MVCWFLCGLWWWTQIYGKSGIFSLGMSIVYWNDYLLQNLGSCTNCGKKWNFLIWTCHMDQNDNFLQNLGTGTNLWKKWNFQSGHAWSSCTKMTISMKISVLAQICRKSGIFSLDISQWTEITSSWIIDQNSEISVKTWVIMEMLKWWWVVLL